MGISMGVVQAVNTFLIVVCGEDVWVCYTSVL